MLFCPVYERADMESDADFDNVIGVNDLMELLSVFGTEWTATYPQDPAYELAAYLLGVSITSNVSLMHDIQCKNYWIT